MPKLYLASALALALISGPALAQTATKESGSTTTVSPGSSSYERSEKQTDAMGNTVEKSEAEKNDVLGSKSKKEQKVERRDGSSESVKRERSSDPMGSSSSSSKTTIDR
jgi:hypothetical protein